MARRKRRSSGTSRDPRRSGVIVLVDAEAPNAPLGTCRFCGDKLIGKRASIRRYCYPDREGKNCVEDFKNSRVYNPRHALTKSARMKAERWMHCAACNEIVAKIKPKGIVEYVGVKPWEADHIVPISWGGDHSLANLQALCIPCHYEKTLRESRDRRAMMYGL